MRRFLVSAAAIAVLSLPAATLGAPPDQSTGKSGMVQASRFIIDGCLYSDVYISAFEQQGSYVPERVNVTEMQLIIFQQDICGGGVLRNVFFGGPISGQLIFDPNFDSATLNTTETLFDYASGQWLPFAIDLTWTRTGPLMRSVFTAKDRDGSCHYITVNRGTLSDATLSGSIAYGSTNYAPAPPDFALMNFGSWHENFNEWTNCRSQ